MAAGNLTFLPVASKGYLGTVAKCRGDTQIYSVPSYWVLLLSQSYVNGFCDPSAKDRAGPCQPQSNYASGQLTLSEKGSLARESRRGALQSTDKNGLILLVSDCCVKRSW